MKQYDMSAQNVKEEQQREQADKKLEEFRGEISGSQKGLHAGTYIVATHEQNKTEAKKKKEREHQKQTNAFIYESQRMYNELMAKINGQLDQINKNLTNIQTNMEQNRQEWEIRAQRLDGIDDLYEDLRASGQLDMNAAKLLAKKAGKDVPDNITQADMVTLLNTIKYEDINAIEELDVQYITYGHSYDIENKRKEKLEDIGERAKSIYDDPNITEEEKQQAYAELTKEYKATEIYSAATEENNSEIKENLKNSYEEKTASSQKATTFSPNALSGF